MSSDFHFKIIILPPGWIDFLEASKPFVSCFYAEFVQSDCTEEPLAVEIMIDGLRSCCPNLFYF